MASWAPTVANASLTTSMSALLLCDASLPPFNKSPFAELSAKAATCGPTKVIHNNILHYSSVEHSGNGVATLCNKLLLFGALKFTH